MRPSRLVAALAFTLAACGSGFAPTAREVAGVYNATVFTTNGSGILTDQLALGATIQINLAEGGATSGQIYVPGGNSDGSALKAALDGTWSLSGDKVSFNQTADTFLRDMTFTATDTSLDADNTFSGIRVKVTLQRQVPVADAGGVGRR